MQVWRRDAGSSHNHIPVLIDSFISTVSAVIASDCILMLLNMLTPFIGRTRPSGSIKLTEPDTFFTHEYAPVKPVQPWP